MGTQPTLDPAVEDTEAWKRARKRARRLREFYGHLMTYVLVSTLLVVIDLATGSSGRTFLGLDWAFWPIGGWGVGVLLQAVRLFGRGATWEQRKAEELYAKERERTTLR